MGLDGRRYDVVLGLEVVVDVARGDVGHLGDVRERGPLGALLVQELHRGADQPLALPRPPRDGGRGFQC